MSKIDEAAKKAGIKTILRYLKKNPEKHFKQIMDIVDKLAGDTFVSQRALVREAIVDDPNSNWHRLAVRVLQDTDPKQVDQVLTSFFINAVFDIMLIIKLIITI